MSSSSSLSINMTSTNLSSLSDLNQSAAAAVSVPSSDIQSDAAVCHDQLLMDVIWVRLVLCLFYLIIFVLGVFGNTLVILVILRNKAMQTPTNIFIVNMAFSDVLMCLFAVPFTPLHSFMKEWYFGDMLCKLFPTSQVRKQYRYS